MSAAPAIDPAERIAQLQIKLAARQGRPGFKRNSIAIRGEIARLQAHTQPEATDGQT